VIRVGQSLSPGNELRDYFSSKSADQPDGTNLYGIKDPVVDALVEQVITAPTYHDVVIRTRALDRVLQWGYYMVPHWVAKTTLLATWDKFGRPAKLPDPAYGLGEDSWWIDPVKVANLQRNASAATDATTNQAATTDAPASPNSTPSSNNTTSGSSAPSNTATQTPPAAPASGAAPAAATPSQDRGQTPIYGALLGVVLGFILGRIGRKK
jgi:microcin C transport system substrate-binding protein